MDVTNGVDLRKEGQGGARVRFEGDIAEWPAAKSV
jgi:hypothetical protein